jgi:cation-transporting ATPase F
MLCLQLLFTYASWMNRLFHSAPIDPVWWLGITGVGLVVFLIVEVEKWLGRRLRTRRTARTPRTERPAPAEPGGRDV